MKDHVSKKVNRIGEKSVLDALLGKWGLGYKEFANYLGISDVTLRQYRRGKRILRLDWVQIQELEKLLDKVGMTFQDLPPDWIKDQPDEKNYLD